MKTGTARIFAPEQWGSLEKFSRFYSSTYKLSKTGTRSVSGAISHFRKALILKDLAIKLVPNLDADEKELDQSGFTNAINSKELSAVVEGVFLELYSTLDCTRKVITEIYSKYQGVPNSTRRYFNRVMTGKIDKNFPEQLIIAVTEVTWYEEFRDMRDELTHLETGSCHRDNITGKIRYMHSGFIKDNKCLIIDDIFLKIDQYINDINQFTGRVFAYLLTQLKGERVLQFCGIFDGRMYSRYVSPMEAVDFHSGICDSKKWFDLNENPRCIFADKCGAYTKAN